MSHVPEQSEEKKDVFFIFYQNPYNFTANMVRNNSLC